MIISCTGICCTGIYIYTIDIARPTAAYIMLVTFLLAYSITDSG